MHKIEHDGGLFLSLPTSLPGATCGHSIKASAVVSSSPLTAPCMISLPVSLPLASSLEHRRRYRPSPQKVGLEINTAAVTRHQEGLSKSGEAGQFNPIIIHDTGFKVTKTAR